MKEEVINCIQNRSYLVFESLRQIRMKQPDIRQSNISAKRKLPPSEWTTRLIAHGLPAPKKSKNNKSKGNRFISSILTVVVPSQSNASNAPSTSTSTRRIVSN